MRYATISVLWRRNDYMKIVNSSLKNLRVLIADLNVPASM